jgi:hypothetical protein
MFLAISVALLFPLWISVWLFFDPIVLFMSGPGPGYSKIADTIMNVAMHGGAFLLLPAAPVMMLVFNILPGMGVFVCWWGYDETRSVFLSAVFCSIPACVVLGTAIVEHWQAGKEIFELMLGAWIVASSLLCFFLRFYETRIYPPKLSVSTHGAPQ